MSYQRTNDMAQFAVYEADAKRLEKQDDVEHELVAVYEDNESAQRYATLRGVGMSNVGNHPPDFRVVPASNDFDYPDNAQNEELNEIVREYNYLFP